MFIFLAFRVTFTFLFVFLHVVFVHQFHARLTCLFERIIAFILCPEDKTFEDIALT